VFLDTTESTNAVAMDLGRKGAPEGTVVVADYQTAGRGRLGRRWLAPPGTCLLCSVVFRPDLALQHLHGLTMLSALAAADSILAIAGLATAVKWPNDLVVASSRGGREASAVWRKLAGLLTEGDVAGESSSVVVVGIGINVNVRRDGLPSLADNATSVQAEVERPTDRAALFGALMAEIEMRYDLLRAGESPRSEWASRMVTLGRTVQATTPSSSLVGVAEGVDEEGALLLRTREGAQHRVTAADVTLARFAEKGTSGAQ
jgi:BirA family biotin operon repressor/biotin-[acetyl-CoA-carboxylase] ligase